MSENVELLNAVLSSNLGLVMRLTNSIENVDYPIDGFEGLTLLHVASGISSIESALIALHLLTKKNADPNCRSYDDLTPVHISTMWNNFLVLEKLLTFGGDPFLKDYNGKNSFDLALDNDAKECYDMLQLFKSTGRNAFIRKNDSHKQSSVNVKHFPSASANCNSQLKDTGYLLKDDKMSRKSLERLNFKKTEEWVLSSTPKSDKMADVMQCGIIQQMKKADPEVEVICLDSTKGNVSDDGTIIGIENCSSEIHTTYTDEEEGIVLIEKQCLPVPLLNDYACSESSFLSDWKMYKTAYSHLSDSSHSSSLYKQVTIPDELLQLNNTEIFSQLKTYGEDPGPVMDCTRPIYLQRLAKLKRGLASSPSKLKYPPEVYMFLSDGLNIQRIRQLELELIHDFEMGSKTREYREGNQRCSFTYFLLDPRVTQNLPLRVGSMSFSEAFTVFLDALFYVGKGTRGRPYSHLYESVKAMDSASNIMYSEKVKHILDIWHSGLGVISLSCFHNSLPVESYTREACVIEAVGLGNLTNIKKGNFYGVASKWTQSRRRQFGVLILSRALEIFLLEGERIIQPKDIAKS